MAPSAPTTTLTESERPLPLDLAPSENRPRGAGSYKPPSKPPSSLPIRGVGSGDASSDEAGSAAGTPTKHHPATARDSGTPDGDKHPEHPYTSPSRGHGTGPTPSPRDIASTKRRVVAPLTGASDIYIN